MKIIKLVSITILALIALILFLFAAFPNSTRPYSGFDYTALNIFLYCVLPFFIGLFILVAIFFLTRKDKVLLLTTGIIFTLLELVMIAYTIYLHIAATPGWIGIYFNVATDIIIALSIGFSFFKYNKVKKLAII